MNTDTTIWSGFAASFLPLVLTVATTLVGVATTVITVRLNSFFGITNDTAQKANEQLVRNVLHDAVWSAVKYAAQKTGMSTEQLAAIDGPTSTSPLAKEFTDVAIGYVRSKNPDTVVAAGLTPDAKGDAGLTEIILSKVPDLIKLMVDAAAPGPVGAVAGALIDAAAKSIAAGGPKVSFPATSPRKGG